MFSLLNLRFACICLATAGITAPGYAGQSNSSIPVSSVRASATTTPSAMAPVKTISLEMRGDIYMARKMYREAIDTYRQGAPDSAILANKVGIAFHQMMQFDLAKKNYERAIKLDPKYPEALNNLGTIYYSGKSYRRSIGLYKRALRMGQPSASIEVNLGSAYFARKNYKMAADCYELALHLDPDVFEHHSHFGTLMQERNVEEQAKFHLYLAKTYAKAGANERAISCLRKAFEEGIKNRDKIVDMPEFATLKTDVAFQELLAQDPKPL